MDTKVLGWLRDLGVSLGSNHCLYVYAYCRLPALSGFDDYISARGILAQGLSFDEASVRELETRCDAERQNVRQCKDVVGRLAQETAGESALLAPHAPCLSTSATFGLRGRDGAPSPAPCTAACV